MKRAVLLTIVLLVVFIQSPGQIKKSAVDTRLPQISIDEALATGKKYVEQHQIDVSDKYIDSVQLNLNPQEEKGKYWKITWELSYFAKGGQVFLFIYMDKSVEVFYGE